MKPWIKILAGVVALLFVAVLAIPFFVNANTFRPLLEKQLTAALGRQVTLGDLSLSLFSGKLVAKDIAIADDPAFSAKPFIAAKALKVGVEMGPLLFHRTLRVTGFSADGPEIHIVHSANGGFNFSSLGKNAASRNPGAEAGKESVLPDLTVGEISIRDGRAVVENLPASGPPRVYNHVNLDVKQFSFAKQFPFTLTGNLPGGGELSLKGKAGPVSAADAANSPFEADVSLKHLDPVAGGFVKPEAGFSMLADIDAHAASDGRTLSSTGKVHADKLRLVKNGTPTPRPVDVTYDAAHDLATRTGTVRDLVVQTGRVGAHANGTYELTPAQTLLKMKLSAQSLPIDDLQQLLPALGVYLPKGSVLTGGALTTNLSASGPTTALVISGPLQVDNTKLAGFNLGSKLSGLATLAGVNTGNATEIRQLKLNLQATQAGVRTDNIYCLVPALGTATGAGTVSAAGALAYKLNVRLDTAHGVGGAAMSGVSLLNSAFGKTASSAASGGVPLIITGTTSDPHFSADLKALSGSLLAGQASGLLGGKTGGLLGGAKGTQQNPADTVKSLTGLFGKKK